MEKINVKYSCDLNEIESIYNKIISNDKSNDSKNKGVYQSAREIYQPIRICPKIS